MCVGGGGACVDAGEGERQSEICNYEIRLCIVVMFHVQRFEPHTCTVIEGFGTLEMHFITIIIIIK